MLNEEIIYASLAFFLGSIIANFSIRRIFLRTSEMREQFRLGSLLICIVLTAVLLFGAYFAFTLGSRVGTLAVFGLVSGTISAIRSR